MVREQNPKNVKKISQKILQKSASAVMAFSLVATSMPAMFSTDYVAKVSAQTASVPANQQITGLTFTVTPNPDSYIAYVNPTSGAIPAEVSVVMNATIAEQYEGNGVIKLALPQAPTGAQWTEKHGAFFNYASYESTIVKEVDTTTEPGKILIKLKNKAEGMTAGFHPITVKFAFNQQYANKIPVDTVLYNIQPIAYIGDAVAVSPQAVNIIAKNTVLDKNLKVIKKTPEATEWTGWDIAFYMEASMHSWQTLTWDRSKQSRLIVQVPVGSKLSGRLVPNYWTFDKKVIVDGIEYDQYIHNIDITADGQIQAKDFNAFQGYNTITRNNYNDDITVTPPTSMEIDGKNIKIRQGVEYYFINHTPDIRFNELEYTYTNKPEWGLYTSSAGLYLGTMMVQRNIVRSDSTTPSINTVRTAADLYADRYNVKNIGTEPIKGVKFELFQAWKATENNVETDSAHVNYNIIWLDAIRQSATSTWSQYKYYFEITDTKKTTAIGDDTVRSTLADAQIFKPTSANLRQTIRMVLPTLKDGEYISNVILVPMGADGQREWDLIPENSHRIYFNTIGNNNTWPDGSTNTGRSIKIPMQTKMTYLDNPNKPAAYPSDTSNLPTAEVVGNKYDVNYMNYPHAGMRVYKQEAGASVNPGGTVAYKLIGTNSVWLTTAAWENPRIIIRVPKFVTIKDLDTPKTLLDTSGTATDGQTATVNVTLVSSDTTHNYYNFQVENYTAIPIGNDNFAHFEIPFEFEIANNALAGSYNIDYIVSQKDAENFNQALNQVRAANYLPAGMTREKIGMKEGDFWNYWGAANAENAISILRQSSATPTTTIKNSATNNQFSPASVVPAKSNEDVTIRLTVTNNGSTELEKLKIYDILPYTGDALNSNGNILLKSVTSNKTGIRIQTTKTPHAQLAKYGEHNTTSVTEPDLQTIKLPGTWTDGIPDDKNGISGLFIDFGTTRILPGESVNVDMIFTIPDEVSQRAFNQFRYSAQEVGNANVKFNLNSLKAGFDTTYIDNVPPVVTLIGANTATLAVGETFKDQGANWTDNIDGSGKIAHGKIISKDGTAMDSDDTPTEVGVYVLEYAYTDGGGNTAKVTRTVTIRAADKTELRKNATAGATLGQNKKIVGINGVDADTAKQALLDALLEAKAQLDNPNATQADVDRANTVVVNAMKNLAVDSTPPEIIFPNNLQNNFTVGSSVDLMDGITATDKISATDTRPTNVTASLTNTSNPTFNAEKSGTYTITYTATDAVGNKSTKTRTITIAPANKDALIAKNTEAGTKLADPKLIENNDAQALKDLRTEVQGIIDNPDAKPDEIANAITRLEAAIAALDFDTVPPVITEDDAATDKNNQVGSSINFLEGITAEDDVDGDKTPDITFKVVKQVTGATGVTTGDTIVTGNAATPSAPIKEVGDYIMVYTVTDAHGNTATHTRNITIVSVDKTELIDEKKKGEETLADPNIVDDDAKKALEDAIKNADEVINNPNATADEVAKAIEDLKNAIKNVNIKKPNTWTGPGGYVAPVDTTQPANPTTPATPNTSNTGISTQDITQKNDSENIFSINNPLTNAVCTDIIRAYEYSDLIVKDNPQNAPFHDDIAALMMFRGAEKSGANIPNYEEYKRHGVVLNAEYYSPNRSVTRAEFVKMLVRSLSCRYEHIGTDTGFSDVENDKWYAEYIKFAVENKWINGYKDGTFRPNAPITRDEAAKILSRAISLDTEKSATETTFSDVENGSEFIPYIESLKNLGVMKGRTAEKFAPKEQISRGETARIIYRTFLGGKN